MSTTYTFRPIARVDATAIARWRYPDPYSMYDLSDDDADALLAPENGYHAVTDAAGDLVGFCSFGADARVPGFAYDDDALDIGLGMRPDLTGRGLGLACTRAVLEYGRRAFGPDAYRVTVAAFNRRTQR